MFGLFCLRVRGASSPLLKVYMAWMPLSLMVSSSACSCCLMRLSVISFLSIHRCTWQSITGFRYSERGRIEPVLAGKGSVDGFEFEVGQFDDPLDSIKGFSDNAEAHGYDALVNVRLAPEDPAEFPCDDLWTANRVLLAALAGYVYPVRVFLDTFMDHDRGYFPRIGLYDRLLNPRRSAVVLRNLNAAFSRYGVPVSEPVVESVDGWTRVSFHSEDANYILMLPDSVESCVVGSGGDVVDLVTGVINPDEVCDGSQYLVINRFMGA